MRAPLALLLALVLAILPGAQAQTEHQIPAGTTFEVAIAASDGQTLSLDVLANTSVDVLLVRGGGSAAYFAGNATLVWGQFNASEAHVRLTLHGDGELWLLVDNSPQPNNGAPGQTDATATIDIVLERAVVTAPDAPTPGEERTLWRALMFTADYWEVGAIGFGSVAVWMAIFAAVAAYRFDSPLARLAGLAGGIAGLTFLWALMPHPGMVSQVGLPLIIGGGAGYLAAQASRTLPKALRLAALTTILGAMVGLTAAHFVRALWQEPAMFVLGGEGFLDALFTVPFAAVAVAALAKFVPAFVHALDDEDDVGSVAHSAPLGQTFNVTCLRCGTAITVNRSVKRYRVATDRYEFPCPNCHAWMEWAEPKPAAAN